MIRKDTIIGQPVKKYLITTCPYCRESTRVDWKEVVYLSYLSEGSHLVTVECGHCQKEYEHELYVGKDTFQIVTQSN